MRRKPDGTLVPTALQRHRLSAALVINHTRPIRHPIKPVSELQVIETVDFYACKKTKTPSP